MSEATDADRERAKSIEPQGVHSWIELAAPVFAAHRIAAERATVERIVKQLKQIEFTAAAASDSNDRFYRIVGDHVVEFIKELENDMK